MKAFLWLVFVFAVIMLLLNLSSIQLSLERTAAGPRVRTYSRPHAPPQAPAPEKPSSAVKVGLYAGGGIFLIALAWWLSSAPRVLAGVSLPPAMYLAYVQTLAEPSADQRVASAMIGLFLAIATGLAQLRGK